MIRAIAYNRRPMRILLVDDSLPFDGYTPSSQPLGGVEKAFARLPAALRRRGHEVDVANRCRFPIMADGVQWRPWEAPQPEACDVLIAYRKPALLDFPVEAKRRILWLASPADYLGRGENPAILARHDTAPIVVAGPRHAATVPAAFAARVVEIAPGVGAPFREAEPMAPASPPRAVVTTHPLMDLGWLIDLWVRAIRPGAEGAELHVYSAMLDKGQLGGEVPEAIRPVLDRALEAREHGVVILRPRGDPDMAEAYRAARVHLYPGAAAEVYCATLAESQAVGLPAVARPFPATRERVVDGETGFIAPDDEAFASCAILLLVNDGIFASRSEAARNLQRGRGWDEAAAAFEALFP